MTGRILDPRVEEMKIEGTEFLFILDSRHRTDFAMDFHRHDFFELSFVMEGRGECQKIGPEGIENFNIQKNNIILWDGRVPHRAADCEEAPLEQLIIIFDDAYLRRLKDYDLVLEALKRKNPFLLTNSLHTIPLKTHFREVLNEIRTKEVGRDSLVFSLLSRLLIQIIRAEGDQMNALSGDHRINRVLDYIHQNFFMNISIQSAAEMSSLSLRQFSEVFKKETGKTFTRYLNGFRIEKAKEALRNSRLSITEIAFETGFDDLSYFTRRFKAYENMSPRNYRKQFGT